MQTKQEKKEYDKNWRKDNYDKLRLYEKKRLKQRRDLVKNYKLLKGCQICGYNKCATALCFHHPNDDKEFGIASNLTISLKRLEEEMEKCIVLCQNCHSEIHEKSQGSPSVGTPVS